MFFEFPSFDDMLTDRIAEIAEFSPAEAEAVEFGALTIVGIISETAAEVSEGNPEVEAAITALFDKANDRIERVRVATVEAQVAEVEVEDCEDDEPQTYTDGPSPTDEEYAAVNDLVEGLFAMLVGPEKAAEVRAEVERRDAETGTKWGDAVTEEVEEETTPEQEVEDFLANLFRVA